jgi:hypothetical protein
MGKAWSIGKLSAADFLQWSSLRGVGAFVVLAVVYRVITVWQRREGSILSFIQFFPGSGITLITNGQERCSCIRKSIGAVFE